MGHRVGLHHSTRYRKGSRCLVTTFIHLPFVRAEGHILVIPEPARSIGNVALDAAVRTPFERRYALVPPGFRPTGWRSVLRLEAMAGRPLVEQARPAVRVVAVRQGPKVAVPPGLPRKRKLIWANQERNAVVARAALVAAKKSGRVRILVESAEHGRTLARLLPTWPLLHLSSRAGGAAECESRESDARSPHAILTAAWLNAQGGDGGPAGRPHQRRRRADRSALFEGGETALVGPAAHLGRRLRRHVRRGCEA